MTRTIASLAGFVVFFGATAMAQTPMFSLKSPVFADHGEIPTKYSCEGKDMSPPLTWSDAPSATQAYALIVDDPDAPDPAAPKMVWVHWVIYNIPADVTSLGENAGAKMPDGAVSGLNDWKKKGYGGPCPPTGKHRYFFKLYALDSPLSKIANPTKQAVEQAMAGHVLSKTELVGLYKKKKAD